jgi:hypothetical protein
MEEGKAGSTPADADAADAAADTHPVVKKPVFSLQRAAAVGGGGGGGEKEEQNRAAGGSCIAGLSVCKLAEEGKNRDFTWASFTGFVRRAVICDPTAATIDLFGPSAAVMSCIVSVAIRTN